MSLSEIIGYASAALAVYFYKQSSDLEKEIELENKAHEAYVRELLAANSALENKIDPNLGSYQSPIIFSVTMRSGGQMLEQNEITLNCTNPTDSIVEISDFQARIWVAGYMADLCVPANILSIKIPAKKTVSFRLYARYGKMFRNYIEVKRALNLLYSGKAASTMKAGTFIPMENDPVLMNMQYLWVGKGFEDECFAYNIPGSFRWKYAGWTVGSYVGYNAGNENQQKTNPSYWTGTQEIDSIDE